MSGQEGVEAQLSQSVISGPGALPAVDFAPGADVPVVARDEFWEGVTPAEAETAVAETADVVPGEAVALVEPTEVTNWLQRAAQAVRAAGSRGTWDGRRGVRDSREVSVREDEGAQGAVHINDLTEPVVDKPKGRYQGPCKLPPKALDHVLVEEYGIEQAS